VRIIVGFPPGGGTDILARLIGQWLSERLNQAFVVENRPGAGANIATETVVRAPADGYTLLMAGTSTRATRPCTTSLVSTYQRHRASRRRHADVQCRRGTSIISAKTIPEFIAHAKTNPAGSHGVAWHRTVSHMSGELLR